MADERYRSDNTNRHASPTQGGRTSSRDYGHSYSAGYDRSEATQPRAQRYDSPNTQDCYPSGRPKTQRQYADDSHARYAEGGYSARATSHEYGADRAGSSARYVQQPSYTPQAGYDQDRYDQSEASWRGGYAQDGYTARHDGHEQGDYRAAHAAGNRFSQPQREGGRYAQDAHGTAQARPSQAHTASHAAYNTAAAAPALPEPLARVVELMQSNPIYPVAAVGAVALLVIIALVGSCVAGNANQGYVQAESSQGSAPAASSTADTTTAGTSAGATPSDTPAAGTSTDTGTTDATSATQQPATDSHDQTPRDVDDVSTIAQGDVWSYSTTSFNKDAAYNSGGVEDPWSPTGYFTTGDAELDQLVKNYCDSQAQDGLDAGDNAYYTYLHISWIDYVENDQNQRPWDIEGDWRITYAKQCFTNMTANCYEFAAAIQYIMRYYGYADAIAEPCLVLRQSGNWGDHGLVFLTSLDGRQCLIDASLSSNGWLLPATSLSYTLDTGYRAS